MKRLFGLLLLIPLLGCAASPSESSSTWVIPAIVKVGNVYPGAYADQVVQIHNSKSTASQYVIKYKIPDGPITAPEDAGKWITISNASPIIGAKQTQKVTIALLIPIAANLPESWEFWISIQDTSTPNRPELFQRWYVSK
jgi:hypothetical protein